ncbi:uncharacterized protein MKZ38_006920 [Zalerion maritima]|uniref:Uncharacterized protein n=1 Tax=Zalerion maritima TaxID=339359 RepID=A0AAD5WW39_9PEZI|nr:uncharacterized protein MKZ38_006920 [Zalerion maritima]
MVFEAPAWVPKVPIEIPDSITLEEFMASEKYGRRPAAKSRNPYTCGITGRTYTAVEVIDRTRNIAKAIAKRTGWTPNEGTPWDKVVGIFSLNTIDYIPLAHAVHRLNGIVTPASAAYSAPEAEHQLRASGAKILFTCLPLLEAALAAAKNVGIPKDKIFLLDMPVPDKKTPYVPISALAEEGKSLPDLEPLQWCKGQGARQAAFLCFSSGTSGLPKAVMISHLNVIANVMNHAAFESHAVKLSGPETEVVLGLLPLSHIYGLVVIAHCGTYRGSEIIILPRFEMNSYLNAIEQFKIERLVVVNECATSPRVWYMPDGYDADFCDIGKKDLSSVRVLYTGAAPMGIQTLADTQRLWPDWKIGQGYGMTETSTIICTTSEHDIFIGSSGSIIPNTRGKIMGFDGKEVTTHDTPGELWAQGPSVVLGYLNNEKANAETFVWDHDGRWIKTGDEVVVSKAPSGNEHLFIVDRIKELIKVKGHQVAPAELEAHLLAHPMVNDTAVIPVLDDHAGEVAKAFVVKAASETEGLSDPEICRSIAKHVEDHKAKYKWLSGGIEFIDGIPKSPSGKILRRLLRDKEKASRAKKGARL